MELLLAHRGNVNVENCAVLPKTRGAPPGALLRVVHVTALHVAAERDSVQMVELLIRQGAECTAADSNGDTPLLRAVRTRLFENVKRLCVGSAANRAGETPLHIILLVSNKADLEEERQVGAHQAAEFADRHRLEATETSAHSGRNIPEAFARLAREILTRVKSREITPATSVRPLTNDGAGGEPVPNCC